MDVHETTHSPGGAKRAPEYAACDEETGYGNTGLDRASGGRISASHRKMAGMTSNVDMPRPFFQLTRVHGVTPQSTCTCGEAGWLLRESETRQRKPKLTKPNTQR